MFCHMTRQGNVADSESSSVCQKKVESTEVIHSSQLSPEIFDPRKVDPKFLEANFEYFILSTARDDENK